jgi:hypothetical protein
VASQWCEPCWVCRDNRLSPGTFGSWLKALDALELARIRARELRKRTHDPISNDRHNKAVPAFWAMHVEALNWSGLIAKAYAEAHRISINSLRTWRARRDACPMQIDWRARLHPSARLAVSTNASDSAKGPPAENILTAAPATDPPTSERRRRRRFSGVEERAIVLETEQPGATVSQIG